MLLRHHQIRTTVLFTLLIACNMAFVKLARASEENLCAELPKSAQKPCQEAFDLLTQMPDAASADLTVLVTGSQNAWRYEYRLPSASPDSGADVTCTAPGVLTLPQGKNVRLVITAEDQIYEWEVPSLDMRVSGIPGRIEEVNVDTSKTGVFSGLSGDDSKDLTPEIHILEADAFAVWENETLRKSCMVK